MASYSMLVGMIQQRGKTDGAREEGDTGGREVEI